MSPLFSLATPSALSIRIVFLKFSAFSSWGPGFSFSRNTYVSSTRTQHRCLILYVTAGLLYFITDDNKKRSILVIDEASTQQSAPPSPPPDTPHGHSNSSTPSMFTPERAGQTGWLTVNQTVSFCSVILSLQGGTPPSSAPNKTGFLYQPHSNSTVPKHHVKGAFFPASSNHPACPPTRPLQSVHTTCPRHYQTLTIPWRSRIILNGVMRGGTDESKVKTSLILKRFCTPILQIDFFCLFVE